MVESDRECHKKIGINLTPCFLSGGSTAAAESRRFPSRTRCSHLNQQAV